MEIKYSKYEPSYRDELKAIVEKLQDYIVSIDSFDRVIRAGGFSDYVLEKLLSKRQTGEGEIFLAIAGSKVVGVVAVEILARSADYDLQVKKGRYGEIEKLYVEEEYRGKGIGRKLFELAEGYLIEDLRCDFIEVVVFGDNESALDMYKKSGYREREYVLLKKV